MRASLPLLAALIAAAAFAQIESPSYVSRELKFQHAHSAQQFQEIATVVRAIAELPQVSVMETAGRLAIRGPKDRIPTAEWVFAELDQPPPPKLPSASETHLMPEHPHQENVVRVFRLAHASSPQALQEIAVIVRSMGEIRRVMTYNETKSVAVRGTVGQLKFAEWMLEELDRPPGKAVTTGREYVTRNLRFEVPVRVFVLPAMPPDRMQESIAEIKKVSEGWVYAHTTLPALAIRTAHEKMDAVKALFAQRGW